MVERGEPLVVELGQPDGLEEAELVPEPEGEVVAVASDFVGLGEAPALGQTVVVELTAAHFAAVGFGVLVPG